MLPTLSFANLYQYMYRTETVNYSVKVAQGSYNPSGQTVLFVYREPLVDKDDWILDFGQLTTDIAVFDLWTANLGGIVPSVDDFLLSDSSTVKWILKDIKTMDYDSAGPQRYKCLCYKAI